MVNTQDVTKSFLRIRNNLDWFKEPLFLTAVFFLN